MYSMIFYICLICKYIPLANIVDETYTSKEESKLYYKYYLSPNDFVYSEDWIEHNYNIKSRYFKY